MSRGMSEKEALELEHENLSRKKAINAQIFVGVLCSRFENAEIKNDITTFVKANSFCQQARVKGAEVVAVKIKIGHGQE